MNYLQKLRNDQKDRLTESIMRSVNGCARHGAEIIADSLLDNGVLFPQVKIGQTLYYLLGSSIMKYRVDIIEIQLSSVFLSLSNWEYEGEHKKMCISENAIGVSLFFTHEEAEAALKRRQNSEKH